MIQVCFVSDSSSRVQVRRSSGLADTSDVAVSPGAKAWFAFAAGLLISQVHVERAANGDDAPGTLMGLPCRVARDDEGMVRRRRKPNLQDR